MQPLSFFVASFFSDVKVLQQNLLEEPSTIKRLQVRQKPADSAHAHAHI